MIKCILSDMGNVFISFDNDIFFKKLADCSPFSFREIAELAWKHSEISREFDQGSITPDVFFQKVKEISKADLSSLSFFKLYNDIFTLREMELDLLNRLRLQYKLVLLSNTDVQRFGFIKDTFPRMLIFDAYVLSYKVGFIKPDPRIYEYAVMQSGVSPQECVFIDDCEENIAGAGIAGINTIHYTADTDLAEELHKFQLLF